MKGKPVRFKYKLVAAMSGIFLLAYGLAILLVARNFYTQSLASEAELLTRENVLQADQFITLIQKTPLTLTHSSGSTRGEKGAKILEASPQAERLQGNFTRREELTPAEAKPAHNLIPTGDRELFVQLDYLLKQSSLELAKLRYVTDEPTDELEGKWTAYQVPVPDKAQDTASMWLVKSGQTTSLKAWQLIKVEDQYFYLETTRPLNSLHQQLHNLLLSFADYALPLLALVILLGQVWTNRLTKDLKLLAQASDQYGRSQEFRPLALRGSRETQALGNIFNRMAEELETQRQALLRENERQDHFIQALNHEYKTPLASMLLHLSLLKEAELTAADKERSLAYLWEAASHLDSIRERLMQLYFNPEGLPSQELELESFLADFLEQVIPLYQEQGCQIELEIIKPETIQANPTLLKQILSNLLDNACEAVQDLEPDQRIIKISADQGRLRVYDPGPGLLPEELRQLKTYFFRATTGTHDQKPGQHLGLGLALVDKICLHYGWQLDFSSGEGRGFTATVSFN